VRAGCRVRFGVEELALACDRARRWELLFIAAPLRIVGGTGSPINPLAVL
jgi:kynurenine formamidase